VLVAEDNRTNQMVARRLLQHLGYGADVAANGLEVLAALERQPYDVVLMDIQMPEMDGLAAARHIVAGRAPGGRPRIVAMTANAMPGDREAYLAAGMDGYVSKPVELDELAAALEQVGLYLGSQQAASATPAPATTPQAQPMPAPGNGQPTPSASRATKGLDGPAATAPPAAPLPPPWDAELLDLHRLDQLSELQSDSQPSLVRELIDLFVADAPAQVAALNMALQAGDLAALRRIAHRLLSSTQNIGAVQMSACCAAIEAAAQAGHADALAPLLQSLTRGTPAVAAALQAARLRY
jgi:CheY-like chemotaxis protein